MKRESAASPRGPSRWREESSPRLPPASLRPPMRHGCHYLDLTAAIASYDDGGDFSRFRQDESSGEDFPAW